MGSISEKSRECSARESLAAAHQLQLEVLSVAGVPPPALLGATRDLYVRCSLVGYDVPLETEVATDTLHPEFAPPGGERFELPTPSCSSLERPTF